MEESDLMGANAHIICPTNLKNVSKVEGMWCTEENVENVANLIEKITEEKGIDKEKRHVILAGGSQGGAGAEYMAKHLSEYLDTVIAFSPVNVSGIKDESEMKTRTLCYVGGRDINASKSHAVDVYGEEGVFTVEGAKHGQVPKMAYNEDKDGDGASDFFEISMPNNKVYDYGIESDSKPIEPTKQTEHQKAKSKEQK